MGSKTGFNVVNCPNVSIMTGSGATASLNAILDFEKLGQFGEILED